MTNQEFFIIPNFSPLYRRGGGGEALSRLPQTKGAIAVTATTPRHSALTLMCSKRRDQAGKIILVTFFLITKTVQMYVYF